MIHVTNTQTVPQLLTTVNVPLTVILVSVRMPIMKTTTARAQNVGLEMRLVVRMTSVQML